MTKQDERQRDPRDGERNRDEQGAERQERDGNGRANLAFGRGSPRDRMGSEQFEAPADYGRYGEQVYRDFGRGQPGGAYDHAGERDYRHGSGYGGFGAAPGESGGGFDSGRSYAAEPGWGPGYGGHTEGSGPGGEDQGRDFHGRKRQRQPQPRRAKQVRP